jgi:hypothetical protein
MVCQVAEKYVFESGIYCPTLNGKINDTEVFMLTVLPEYLNIWQTLQNHPLHRCQHIFAETAAEGIQNSV